DEALGIEGALDLLRRLAPPVPIAMVFDVGRNLDSRTHSSATIISSLNSRADCTPVPDGSTIADDPYETRSPRRPATSARITQRRVAPAGGACATDGSLPP